MSSAPLFSVLIANHNDGKNLDDALQSVFSQSYSNWEIIIVDDASTDNSIQIYEKLSKFENVSIIRNHKQMGCGYTKRSLVEASHGEICGFLDADDCLTSDALEIMVKTHVECPNHSLIYSQYYLADEHLNIIKVSNHQCTIPQGKSFLTYNIPGAISQFATFKKEYYLKTEGMNSLLPVAEDHDLYLKLEEVGEILFIPIPLYYYRTKTGNNTSLNNQNNAIVFGADLIAFADAYHRRNIIPDNDMFYALKEMIKDVQNKNYLEGEQHIKETKSYKIGKVITNILAPPYRTLSKYFHGNHQ